MVGGNAAGGQITIVIIKKVKLVLLKVSKTRHAYKCIKVSERKDTCELN